MAELHEEILHFLEANATFDTLEYSEKKALDHQKVIGAIKSLQTTEGVPLSILFFWPFMTDSCLIGFFHSS